MIDWVVVIKGETVDRKTRVMPSKYEDLWNPKPKQQLALPRVVNSVLAVPPVAATVQTQARAQVQAGTVLRYVENRRVMTSGEAERKMEKIVVETCPSTRLRCHEASRSMLSTGFFSMYSPANFCLKNISLVKPLRLGLFDLYFLRQTRHSATEILSGLLNPAVQSVHLTPAARRPAAASPVLDVKLKQIEI